MTTILERMGAALCVHDWPATAVLPPGLVPVADGSLRAPLSLRARLRRGLLAAGAPFQDLLTPPPLERAQLPPCPEPPPSALATFLQHGCHGIVVGLAEGERIDLVLAAVHHTAARTLLLVRDSGAELQWQARLRERSGTAAIEIVTVAAAAHRLAGRAPQHDLLVVAQPELQPAAVLATALAGLAAAHVLAIVDHPGAELLSMTAWAGPLLQMVRRNDGPELVELHLPLTPEERLEHDAAWHEFLSAYDRFAALRPGAGFHTFVHQARGEPAWRPALLAWHRARRVAQWNVAKARACAPLLARHRAASVLVFTPDRDSAYAIAREHLVAPVTAELPRAERAALLAAFANGTQKVLVGPRLLDLGVAPGRADVGIVVGGGFGLRDRRARHDRVAATGIVYELVAEATAEVGRARRFESLLER